MVFVFCLFSFTFTRKIYPYGVLDSKIEPPCTIGSLLGVFCARGWGGGSSISRHVFSFVPVFPISFVVICLRRLICAYDNVAALLSTFARKERCVAP